MSEPSTFICTPEYAAERGFKDGDVVDVTAYGRDGKELVTVRMVVAIERKPAGQGDLFGGRGQDGPYRAGA